MKQPPSGLTLQEQAKWHLDEADRYGRYAVRCAYVSIALALLSIAINIVGRVAA